MIWRGWKVMRGLWKKEDEDYGGKGMRIMEEGG